MCIRDRYRVVAKRGSDLYFVIADLALIDPMYQYSLEYFIKLFKRRLEVSDHPDSTARRIDTIIADITEAFYVNICRGLFEKDKVIYSFLIAVKIMLNNGLISLKEWNFYIRGPTLDKKEIEHLPPCPSYLSEKMWIDINGFMKLGPEFATLAKSFESTGDSLIWREILDNPNPWEVELPPPFKNDATEFQKLLLYKILREERLIMLNKMFIRTYLGDKFIESPPFDLKAAYGDSAATTPIIFVLSPGADPIPYLYNLAKEKGMDGPRLKMLSLGQGQGEKAEEAIRTGRRNGDWVCLQNCHLAATWMSDLEKIQEQQIEADPSPEYRLWLTSMPTTRFPVPVLQSGIKLTNEPPKGLKANLLRTYQDVSEDQYENCLKPFEYKKLLFSLAFFHAVILERRKFGAIGWNIPYEWMNSDFVTSQAQVKMYLEEQPEVPYVALNVLVSEINYGGRVTDDKDVRLIKGILEKYFNPEVLSDNYAFSGNKTYVSPPKHALLLQDVKNYISSFPLDDDPEVFGLHSNANITFQQKNVSEFMDTLLIIQPKASGGSSDEVSPDDLVFALADEIKRKLPDSLITKTKIDKNSSSLQVFRAQEVSRFNALAGLMRKSLDELQKAIRGLVVMSSDLEKMYNSFIDKKVPILWENVAYPSLKPLGSWVDDLVMRLEFMREWIELEVPKSYWISAFFFPQGFLTASLQMYARKTLTPIDTLVFRTEVKHFHKNNVEVVPDAVSYTHLTLPTIYSV
eukprot:TRINITY_DN7991_c0_g2_i3.p1 TRINITY_DN7991_c0_g2~~TRINITY_DN7991_c0_g2_i3.p1  ORF type:complete len:773 (+),score=234.51 TRINITY_DN7991_c0_g2_i3:90-2321(+)